jgi:hypothetical protein
MLTEDDKQWISQRLEKVETTLLTEFHKWASPVELRQKATRRPFARWTPKLNLSQTGSKISKAADCSLLSGIPHSTPELHGQDNLYAVD